MECLLTFSSNSGKGLLTFSLNSGNAYWHSVEIRGMITDIQIKFRECLLRFSLNSENACWHSVQTQGKLTDIQFEFRECLLRFSLNSGNSDSQLKFRECLLTFSSNSGNTCWDSVQIQGKLTDIQLQFWEYLLMYSLIHLSKNVNIKI